MHVYEKTVISYQTIEFTTRLAFNSSLNTKSFSHAATAVTGLWELHNQV